MNDKTFYFIEGEAYPRVTSILGIIDKPGLKHWAVNEERKYFETALLDVCAHERARDPEWVLGELAKVTSARRKAFQDTTERAADLGSAAHHLIEWETQRMMGNDPGPEPQAPDGAHLARESWKEWAKGVGFKPLRVEHRVHCVHCAFAGSFDVQALVSGVDTICDYKTGKAVYPEAFLQNVAYRHAAEANGITSEAGLILRLPKTAKDPGFEAVPVPPMAYGYFLSACRLWRWKRMSENLPTGKAMTKCDQVRPLRPPMTEVRDHKGRTPAEVLIDHMEHFAGAPGVGLEGWFQLAMECWRRQDCSATEFLGGLLQAYCHRHYTPEDGERAPKALARLSGGTP